MILQYPIDISDLMFNLTYLININEQITIATGETSIRGIRTLPPEKNRLNRKKNAQRYVMNLLRKGYHR